MAFKRVTAAKVAAMDKRTLNKLARLAENFVTIDEEIAELDNAAKELKGSIKALVVDNIEVSGKTRQIVVNGPETGRKIKCAVTHATYQNLDAEGLLKAVPPAVRADLVSEVLDAKKLELVLATGKLSAEFVNQFITETTGDRVSIKPVAD